MPFFGKGKNKIQNPYTMKDFYEFYIEERKDDPSFLVDKSLYYELVDEFYKRAMDYVLDHAGEFKMPYELGTIRVIKRRVNRDSLNAKNVDWAKTNEHGKLIFHLNEHSDYYKYLFQWDKKDMHCDNLFYYRLPMSRANKRRLARNIKSGEYDYYEKK